MGNLWFELTGEYYKSVKKLESTVLMRGKIVVVPFPFTKSILNPDTINGAADLASHYAP